MSLWEFVREKECVRAYASLLERERERERNRERSSAKDGFLN